MAGSLLPSLFFVSVILKVVGRALLLQVSNERGLVREPLDDRGWPFGAQGKLAWVRSRIHD
jgi:hypothetical protein